jgi:tape measure domain-containing protein
MSGLYDVADGAKGLGQKMFVGGAAAGGALVAGVKGALDSFGEIQRIEGGFESMLGSPEAAKAMISDVSNFAAKSPFDNKESAKFTQRLLAAGFAGNEVIPILNKVGNAVALSGGDTEAFGGVLTALSQIKTKGKLSQEELNQITERGIGIGFLSEKLGLTAKQLQNIGGAGIEANKGIAALTEGFGEQGGGKGMARQMETLPGKASSLGDSFEHLKGTIGSAFSEDASKLIGSMDSLIQKADAFAQKNPEMANAVVKGGGGLALAAVGVGAGLNFVGGAARGIADIKALSDAFRGNKSAADAAKLGKLGLAAATVLDAKEERTKTGVADREADALRGVGDAADEVKGKVGELAQSKFDEFLGDPKAAMTAWKGQALGAVSGVRSALAAPLSLPGIGGLSQVGAFGRGGAPVSNGLAAGSVALGAAAGYGAYDDYSSLGVGKMESMAAGAFTGVGAAAAAMFVPGGAIAVALATGARYAFNELVNVPMEREAEAGSGLNDAEGAAQSGKSHIQKADQYEALAVRKRQEREDLDSTWGWQPEISRQKGALDLDIQGADAMALQERRLEKQRHTPDGTGNTLAWEESNAAWLQKVNAGRVNTPKAFSSEPGRESVQVLKEGDVKVNVSVSRSQSRIERDAEDYQRRR